MNAEQETTLTIPKFCEKHGITCTAEPVKVRPDADPQDGDHEQDHYRVTLHRGRATMTLHYSMGIGHRRWKKDIPRGVGVREIAAKYPPVRPWHEKETVDVRAARRQYTEGTPPTVQQVMESLWCDAQSVESVSGFEDWARDLGMDTDSRRAERIYNSTLEQTKKLRKLLGPVAYCELVTNVRED